MEKIQEVPQVKAFRQIPMLMKALHQCAHPEQYQEESFMTA
ncbi:hypothetical protein N007_11280 [Alicyclobacillus acidoterrestris ATCC 49025]|nr:hypothetical protein N007_11280 [Alicyclobacillus acidoterrestris ATCC 49025]